MRRYEISDEHWQAIRDKLPCQPGYQGKGVDNRLFINAVMYVAKCGIPWRDLPPRFGSWNSVYVRFRRWATKGVWQNIFKEMGDKEFKTLLIDSTAVRVHQHGAGALKKQGRQGSVPASHRQIKGWTDYQDSPLNR
jgi:transposase